MTKIKNSFTLWKTRVEASSYNEFSQNNKFCDIKPFWQLPLKCIMWLLINETR